MAFSTHISEIVPAPLIVVPSVPTKAFSCLDQNSEGPVMSWCILEDGMGSSNPIVKLAPSSTVPI